MPLRHLLAIALGAVSAGPLYGQSLTEFDISGKNELGETEIALKVESEGKDVFALRIADSYVDMYHWEREGHLSIDWSNCRTAEMLRGAGDLGQCIRRAFVSLFGEGDRLAPARLEMQVLAGDKLRVEYAPALGAAEKPLRWIVDASRAGKNWQDFVRTLNPAALEKAAQSLVAAPEAGGGGTPTGFVFFGDAGSGDEKQRAVGKAVGSFCMTQMCRFGLLLGDNFYKDGVGGEDDEQWQTKFEVPYESVSFPFRPVLGNHDHHGNIQAQIDYSARSRKWSMPGRYYSSEDGDVAFFAIDSDDFDATQSQWLADGLRASQRAWKIVYGHHPIYSYGSHGDTSSLKAKLLPLLMRHGVDFYLSGHDHDKQVIEKDGITFIVTGTGGAKLREVRRGRGSVYASSTYGFSHFGIQGGEATLRVLDRDGEVEFERVFSKEQTVARAGRW